MNLKRPSHRRAPVVGARRPKGHAAETGPEPLHLDLDGATGDQVAEVHAWQHRGAPCPAWLAHSEEVNDQ